MALAAEAARPEPKAIEVVDTPAPAPEYYSVVLQGLNKVTGKVSKLEGAVGSAMRFGNLEIVARKCWKSPPEELPENAALLEISELKPGEPPHTIFTGWMFSSSPGLSGIEHPVYDITVIACEATDEPEKEKVKEKKEAK